MLGFWRNEGGGVAVAFALASLPMIGIAGLAVDYMRAASSLGIAGRGRCRGTGFRGKQGTVGEYRLGRKSQVDHE